MWRGALRAFGATLLYADARRSPLGVEQELGIDALNSTTCCKARRHGDLACAERVGARADRLRELALMKPSAVLINTCGPVVDEQSAGRGPGDGVIASGSGCVCPGAPDPENPLFELDNVLLTPHSAGVTVDTWATCEVRVRELATCGTAARRWRSCLEGSCQARCEIEAFTQCKRRRRPCT